MKQKMNTPNTLSLIRVILVPVFMAVTLSLRDVYLWHGLLSLGKILGAALFGLAAFTDFLDGRIARRDGIITDFGKFIDPLADKFMIFGACILFLVIDPVTAPVFVWVSAIIMLRELAVTSMRLVVANVSGLVIAASFLGKCKTVSQIVAILILFLETELGDLFLLIGLPAVADIFFLRILSYLGMAVMAFTTVFSGIDYMRAYMPYINTNK